MARPSQAPSIQPTASATPRPPVSGARPEVEKPRLSLVPSGVPDGATALSALKGPSPGSYFPGTPILEPGARVGILCDTLYGDREIGVDYAAGLQLGAELIEALGFVPVIDRVHAAVEPYFERWAGSPQQRVEHFVRLLDGYQVDAIYPLFGKGGCHGVLDALAETAYRPKRPVVLIGGFSHHTDWSLFGQGARGRGFFSHAISATQCAYWKLLPAANVHNLGAILSGASRVQYRGLTPLNALGSQCGPIEGALCGGNMSAILINAHKPWMPPLQNKIVFCEDYDRHGHDFHRSFSALARLASEAGAAAIVVGAMLPMKRAAHVKLDPERRKLEASHDRAEIDAIVREVASRSPLPMFRHEGICGHGAMNHPLGFGALARITPAADGGAVLDNELQVRS